MHPCGTPVLVHITLNLILFTLAYCRQTNKYLYIQEIILLSSFICNNMFMNTRGCIALNALLE